MGSRSSRSTSLPARRRTSSGMSGPVPRRRKDWPASSGRLTASSPRTAAASTSWTLASSASRRQGCSRTPTPACSGASPSARRTTMTPLILELDDDTWSTQVDRVVRWLATTRMLQGAYASVLESSLDDVAEPHIRSYLDERLEVAREHDTRIDDLYRAFGR